MSGWRGVVALACALSFLGAPVSDPISEAPAGAAATTVESLVKALRPAAANLRDGRVTFLAARGGASLGDGRGSGSDAATARAFLHDHARLFGGADFVATGVSRRGGRAAVRFRQEVDGVPVLGGEVVVHLERGRGVTAVHGETTATRSPVRPAIGPADAARASVAFAAKGEGLEPHRLHASHPALWLYDPSLIGPAAGETPRPVWKVEVRSAVQPVAETVLVDARRGSVVASWSEIAHALNRGICDAGGSYGSVPCTAPFARAEGAGATGIADVDAAYDNTGAAMSFFAGLGRNGIDDAGMPLRATVRYCAPDECPYENAYWDGRQVVYGDGWALADDLVAHELSHGVTDHTSELFYYYQSGAINESLSDVFGELSDLSNDLGNDGPESRWLIGEDLPFGTLRDMRDPARFGEPDRMTSSRYASHTEDFGGVHTNSGVGNKTAYLIADGGAFNGQSVTGLGVEKTAHLYYELATNWLTSGSDYEDLYYSLPAACDALTGSHGVTSGDCAQVAKAVTATELNLQPVTGAAAPEAPTCPPGHTRRDLFFDDIEGDAGANWTSGEIEGHDAWYAPQVPYPGSFDPTYATSGTHNIYGDDYLESADSYLALTRPLTVPPGAYLRFAHAYGFESDGASNFDGGVVELSVDGGSTWTDAAPFFDAGGYGGSVTAPDNALAGRPAFVGDSHGYHSSRIDLGQFAGQTISFRFRLATDANGFSYGWYVDDVRLYECVAPSAPSPSPPASSPSPQASPSSGPAPIPTPAVTLTPPPVLPTQLPVVPTLPPVVASPLEDVPSADVVPPANPSLLSSSHRPGTWSSDPTIDLTLGEARDPSGIEGFSWTWARDEQSVPDQTVDGGPSASLTSPPLDDGMWTFQLRTVDGAGNWSAPARLGPFWIDTTAPTAPEAEEALPIFGRKAPATLTWSAASDHDSGVAGYSLETESASYDSRAMTPLRGGGLIDPSRLSAELEARPGFTYCHRVVASDLAGNKAAGGESCTAFPIDDSQLAAQRRRDWRVVAKTGAYWDERGSRSTTRGATLRRDGVAGARRLALLVATCKVCGEVRVTWNGTPLAPRGRTRAAISLRSRKPGVRLIPFPSFSAPSDGVVEVKTLSARPVTILGLGVSKV